MVTVLIPAFNEEKIIADTISNLKQVEEITKVIVINDGSTDNTSEVAKKAGATTVIDCKKNNGKGNSLNKALELVVSDTVVLLDADVGNTATEIKKLIEPIVQDEADMTIATFPKTNKKSGFGMVKRFANWGVKLFSGEKLSEPLSGQRALNKKALAIVTPFADGFGVEVTMNIKAVVGKLRIKEVETKMSHMVTSRDIGGFYHRGKQLIHIIRALIKIRKVKI